MEIVILTGMSGAGKSVAINFLEDFGYFCVDNVPPQMLKNMVETFIKWDRDHGKSIGKVAFVVDVRSFSMFSGMKKALEELETMDLTVRLIFLEAEDQAIISRYKQSRRNHPLADGIGVLEAIAKERKMILDIKDIAQNVINTTEISPDELKNRLYAILSETQDREKRISVLIQSFGFKYGMPLDCDNVFDVRFIPNPFYVQELRDFSGQDAKVRDFIYSFEETGLYMQKIKDLLDYIMPYYDREGKVRLNIGIGCTGGMHRSVAMTEDLAAFLKEVGYRVSVDHRDLKKDALTRQR